MATNEGNEPLDAPLNEAGFERGLLVAIDAAGGDECPDAGQRCANADAQQQAGPVGGIEEGLPEFAGFATGSGNGKPGIAGCEHEGENAIDDDEREHRGDGVDPANFEMELGVDAVPGGVVDGDGGELDEEEDPLHGPAEDEVVNEGCWWPRDG